MESLRWTLKRCSVLVILLPVASVVWDPQAFHLNRGSRAFYERPSVWKDDAEVLLGADTLAEIHRNGSIDSCRLTVIKKEADRDLIRSTFPELREISKLEMLSLIHACGQVEEMEPREMESIWDYSLRSCIMYPGTLWCGPGDRAANYSELGSSRETDRCCRNHDFCPLKIYAGQPKFGLQPGFLKAAMMCECEFLFEQCLQQAEKTEEQAATVKYAYFDVYKPRCLSVAGEHYTLEDYADVKDGSRAMIYLTLS